MQLIFFNKNLIFRFLVFVAFRISCQLFIIFYLIFFSHFGYEITKNLFDQPNCFEIL